MANHLNKLLKSFLLVACFFSLTSYGQGGILIESGGYLVTNGTATIVVNDAGFINNGTFTKGSGTVSFAGTVGTTSSFIDGTAATNFYNLTVNKASNGIIIARNIGVSNNLTFTSGYLHLNTMVLDLGGAGTIVGESETNNIIGPVGGYVQRTQSLNAPSAVNPGNMGLEITSAADLGSTVIRRGYEQQSGASIYRYFDIIPTNNSSLNATINFNYLDAELAGIAEGNLGVFSSSNGGTIWTNLGADAVNTGSNYVTKNGINQLYRLTLSTISAPLAVQLLYFNARLENRQTWLNWTTASESNSDYFKIERSVDGINFSSLASVNAAGNSSSIINYEYKDINPATGANYYRLRQVDIDGHFTLSKQIRIVLSQNGDAFLTVHPNPAQQQINIIFTSAKNENIRMDLFDTKGTLVGTKKIHVIAGVNELKWDIDALPAGVYSINISASNVKNIQFIKQ
jgi:hypothetical protein